MTATETTPTKAELRGAKRTAARIDGIRRRLGGGNRYYVAPGPQVNDFGACRMWVTDSFFARPLGGWPLAAIFGPAPAAGVYEIGGSPKGEPVRFVSDSVPNLAAVVPDGWDDMAGQEVAVVACLDGTIPVCTTDGHPMLRIPSAAGPNVEAVNPAIVSTLLGSDDVLDASDVDGWDRSPIARPAFRVTRATGAAPRKPVTVWSPVDSVHVSAGRQRSWVAVGILMPVRVRSGRE